MKQRAMRFLASSRAGIGFPQRVIIGVILMIALGAILLGLLIPTAQSTGNASSCTNPLMKAFASLMADLFKLEIFC